MSMSERRILCCNENFETAIIGIDGGKTRGMLNNYANQDQTQIYQILSNTNQEEIIEHLDSGDSSEEPGIVPIFSLSQSKISKVRKEKRECSPPEEEDGGRKRVKFPPQHVKLLEESFAEDQHPSQEVKEKLMHQLDVQETKILVWFQNRRAKEKREIKKLQKIRLQRKQTNAKPPHFWPSDLSFDAPLRHIDPSEQRDSIDQRSPQVQTPISHETEIFVNYMQPQITRIPVLPVRQELQHTIPFTNRNPACSYGNAPQIIPLSNQPHYVECKDSVPMTTIKSFTLTQTPFEPHHNNLVHSNTILLEPQHWEEPIYPIPEPSSCALANYLPIQKYSHPWGGAPNMQPLIHNNIASHREDECANPSCQKINYTLPCNNQY